jgi:hypothetical protein
MINQQEWQRQVRNGLYTQYFWQIIFCKLNSRTRGCMRQKYLMIPVLLASLACLMSEAQSAETDAPANTARLRVYLDSEVSLYPGEYCYGSNNPLAINTAATGFGLFNSHRREGMPVTEDIPGSYNEYVIPAGMPMSVMLKWSGEQDGVNASCGPLGATFFPQAGKDYDVSVGYAGSCFVQIRALYETSPGRASASQTPASSSFACANN